MNESFGREEVEREKEALIPVQRARFDKSTVIRVDIDERIYCIPKLRTEAEACMYDSEMSNESSRAKWSSELVCQTITVSTIRVYGVRELYSIRAMFEKPCSIGLRRVYMIWKCVMNPLEQSGVVS
jgi:hypothetical protein